MDRPRYRCPWPFAARVYTAHPHIQRARYVDVRHGLYVGKGAAYRSIIPSYRIGRNNCQRYYRAYILAICHRARNQWCRWGRNHANGVTASLALAAAYTLARPNNIGAGGRGRHSGCRYGTRPCCGTWPPPYCGSRIEARNSKWNEGLTLAIINVADDRFGGLRYQAGQCCCCIFTAIGRRDNNRIGAHMRDIEADACRVVQR